MHLPEIRAWDQVSGMELFVKIVSRSITLLFLQEVPFLVLEYASSMSATVISLTCNCNEVIVSSRREICLSQKSTLCCQIISFDSFNVNFWLVHYALLFLLNWDICVLDSELPCKWNTESRRLLLTLFFHKQGRSKLRRFSTHASLLE